jgi:hypothetical protein
MRTSRAILLVLILVCAIPLAQAGTTYYYAGANFNQSTDNWTWATSSQAVTAWVTFDTVLVPDTWYYGDYISDWGLSDGVHTIRKSDPGVILSFGEAKFDSSLNITEWGFIAKSSTASIFTRSWTPYDSTSDLVTLGTESTDTRHGTWSTTRPVPEPGSFAMLGSGLLLVVVGALRRARRNYPRHLPG